MDSDDRDPIRREPWRNLQVLVRADSRHVLPSYIGSLTATELALAVSRLSQEDHTRLLGLLSPRDAADLIDQIDDIHAVDLIEDLPPAEAAAIVDQLNSDAQADLLGDLKNEEAEAILEAMPDEAAEGVRQLMQYPDETAGGIMLTEFVAFPGGYSVQDVIEDLRNRHEEYTRYDVQYLYVTDGTKLSGVLRLRDVLMALPGQRLTEIMATDPVRVNVLTSLEQMRDLFETHTYLGLPVTKEGGELVGVVRGADVQGKLTEQTESEFRKASGIVGGEELRSMPVLKRSSRRLSWLSVNVLLNILAASVIALYMDTLEEAIILAVFLPIISDMSGCSGNQAVAVSIRELSLGLVRPGEILRVLFKEASVGLMNGLVLGALLACATLLWKGNPYLGLIVGTALAANTLLSVCLGGSIPLALRAIKADPALASGPMLTTITDMCGFFLLFSLAQLVLPKLA